MMLFRIVILLWYIKLQWIFIRIVSGSSTNMIINNPKLVTRLFDKQKTRVARWDRMCADYLDK